MYKEIPKLHSIVQTGKGQIPPASRTGGYGQTLKRTKDEGIKLWSQVPDLCVLCTLRALSDSQATQA